MTVNSPDQLSQQLQDALLNVTLCLKNPSLTAEARQTLMRTMEVLSTEWGRLRTEGRLTRPEEDYGVLRTITELCDIMATAPEAEVAVLGNVLGRMVDGWEQQHQVEKPSPVSKKGEKSKTKAKPSAASETAAKVAPTPTPTLPPAPKPAIMETPRAEEVSSPPPTPSPTPEPDLMALYMKLDEEVTQGLDEILTVLDKVENTPMPREEAVALLMALSAYQRLLWKKAAGLNRNWELDRVRDEVVRVARDKFMGLWLPPGDRNIDFSVEELQTLHEGYEALARSWQMWRWYEQHADELDKSVVEPLLESITAPMAMVQQVYYDRRMLAEAASQDFTTIMRNTVTDEVRERRWRLEMLGMRCSRQRQRYFIARANLHWEAAKARIERKARQQEALEEFERLLLNPSPDTFEEDVLCALVKCYQVQIPPSNLKLRKLMYDHSWVLENPAIPEQCDLTEPERNAARRFLITLGEHIAKDTFVTVLEEEEPEEELEPNEELMRKARAITEGKKLLMVCFAKRSDIEHHIKQQFGFAKIDWPDTDTIRALSVLEARIRNADLVVAIPRYSKAYWKEARDLCKKLGKPFVLAPRGLSIVHLAQQIVEQATAEG